MNTARILFTIVGLGALTLGLCYAGESSKLPAEQGPHKSHATSVHPADRDQMDRKHSLSNSNGHGAERSGRTAPIYTQTKRASGNELHQPGLKKAATAANGGLMINRTGNQHGQPARLPGGSGAAASGTGVVRSRKAGAAGIGGITTSSARNSAAVLNGTGIKRKP
jgi:hypothetical protein